MQRPGPALIGFASFVLSPNLHITIGRRYDATEQELVEMRNYVDGIIRPMLPMDVAFGNFCHMGENRTIPAYKVYIQNPLIQEFYARFYQDAPGKALYPKPHYHITVDTSEKRTEAEALIRQNRVCRITEVAFNVRVEGAESEVTDEGWKCVLCLGQNLLQQKNCSTAGCDQWRPKQLMPALQPLRNGDWMCPMCNFNIFATKERCFKCGTQKPK